MRGSDLEASSRPGRVRTGSRRLRLQAAHLAVSQPVVDEREQSPSDGDAGHVLVVAPRGDRLVAFSQHRATPYPADGLDRRPAHEARALLICGIPAVKHDRTRGRSLPREARAVKAGPNGPPERGSLDGSGRFRMENREEARQGFLVVLLRFFLSGSASGGCGRPCLSWRSARSRLRDGVRGVPTNVVRPLALGRLSRRQQQGRWEPVADHRWLDAGIAGRRRVRRLERARRRRRLAVCGSSGARVCAPR